MLSSKRSAAAISVVEGVRKMNSLMNVAAEVPAPDAVPVRRLTRAPTQTWVPAPEAVAVRLATSTRTIECDPVPTAVAVRGAMCNPVAPPAVLP